MSPAYLKWLVLQCVFSIYNTFTSDQMSDLSHFLEMYYLKQSFAVLQVFAHVKQPVGLVWFVTKARKALPELLGILSSGTKEGNESDDTLAMACQTSNHLLMKEPDFGKHLLNHSLINSLKDLSQNG